MTNPTFSTTRIAKSAILALMISSSFAASAAIVDVYDAAQLQQALRAAQAGDEIVVNPGVYVGNKSSSTSGNSKAHFFSDRSGNESAPIALRSLSPSNKQILQGENVDSGYVFYLKGDHWVIKDLKFSTAQKGIMLEGANNNQIDNVEVSNIGAEAVHFRYFSSNNELSNCYIHDTGKRVGGEGYGEGVYVGTHDGHTSEKLDNSNDNRIGGCTIGPDVTAEAFDVKSGTNGTVIESNYISAKGIVGISGSPAADSFIDLKGTDNIIRNNKMDWQNDSNLDHAIFTYQEHRNSNVYDNEFTLSSGSAIFHILEETVHSVNNVRLDGGSKIVQADYQNSRWDDNLDSSIEKPAKVYSCFDELPNGCGTVPTEPDPDPEPPTGPSGYTYAADEDEMVVVSGQMDIAYGADSQFNYLYNQTAGVECSSSVFGDPIANVNKACFTKASEVTPPPSGDCAGTVDIVWSEKTEVDLTSNDCIRFDRDVAGETVQAWDSDANNSCDFRGEIESLENSSVVETMSSNYHAFSTLSGTTFKLSATNNCSYLKVRAY
ncbi:right-handed parallel beta-helix repeat-containing protein [Echinimonas agarilytica]|uniref:Right-handed parallel beta-helix repeat-containing protein n=1 Tax=Echinimonas agarilytica TaxID=1215918 RepID=A0AA42B8P4_9GAMM|nr:right-handed parallel beta-helix repeat-containing protein [Echinimonas agarilytica]MCM2680738.1 right-handed parallel beta-helix repeat-containing protein [Echinimonas agarilytica]